MVQNILQSIQDTKTATFSNWYPYNSVLCSFALFYSKLRKRRYDDVIGGGVCGVIGGRVGGSLGRGRGICGGGVIGKIPDDNASNDDNSSSAAAL